MSRNQMYSIPVIVIATLTIGACTKKAPVAQQTTPPAPVQTVQETKPQAAPTQAPVSTPAPIATTPKPSYPDAPTRRRIDELLAKIEDAYFDYDKATLRPDAIQSLAATSAELRNILKDYPDYKLTIEGHADERGSAEYNLALADRRATAAKEYLVGVGIPSSQLSTVSYGRERPSCTESNEGCWQKNRRIHIVAASRE